MSEWCCLFSCEFRSANQPALTNATRPGAGGAERCCFGLLACFDFCPPGLPSPAVFCFSRGGQSDRHRGRRDSVGLSGSVGRALPGDQVESESGCSSHGSVHSCGTQLLPILSSGVFLSSSLLLPPSIPHLSLALGLPTQQKPHTTASATPYPSILTDQTPSASVPLKSTSTTAIPSASASTSASTSASALASAQPNHLFSRLHGSKDWRQ